MPNTYGERESVLGSKYPLLKHIPQEDSHILQQYQGRSMTTVKAECVDKMILWKCKEERTAVDVAPDVSKKKCLGSDNPQENHQTPQECQGRNMTNIRVQCLDEMGLLKCKKQTAADASRVMRTLERPPCPKKTRRMRKPIKSEILRFGKVETRVEVEEDDRCPRGDLFCKEEKFLLHIRTDGYRKNNIPEKWLQGSTEDNCIVPQDDQALNLTSYEKNILQSKVEKSTFHPVGFNSRSRTDSDSSEDYSTIPDYQVDSLGVGTDEATSQIDSEEEMFLTANQSIKDEDADEGYEVSYYCSGNMYHSGTTSKPVGLETHCDKNRGACHPNMLEEKQFICTECGKSFSLYSYLTKHQRSHSGEKPFSCNKCGKCFTYKPSLISHQKVHTGEKPFSCTECGKLFSSKFNLKMHEKIHTGDKPVVCPACGKCFSNNPALVKHLRIHTGEKPFSCPECGKFFSSKSGLNAHLIIHTGEKPYMCSECGKSFANHSNLISHRIIHTGEKPYVCPECGKGFANQSNLAKHKVIHTEEKPFLCMECGKFFTRKGSLDKHRIRIHEKMKLV